MRESTQTLGRRGVALVVAAIVLVLVVALYLGGRAAAGDEEAFGGSDAAATAQLEEAGHEPWFEPLMPPAGGEIARMEPSRDGVPTIAVAAGWPSRRWDRLPAAFINDHPALSLIADDGDRRGDGAPVLVAHTTAEVARTFDADPDGAVTPVLAALGELLGVHTAPDWTHAHRWRFSAPEDSRAEPFHLGDDGIALAGDGWGRSRVETAWRSGTLLGRAVVARLTGG